MKTADNPSLHSKIFFGFCS